LGDKQLVSVQFIVYTPKLIKLIIGIYPLKLFYYDRVRIVKNILVHIISGFLGAGKTITILRIFEQKKLQENWAILVNEFSKISIDGQILKSRSVAGSVYDIAGGCICYSAKAYLCENLEKIVETGKFNRIIIEPSGLGGIEILK